MHEHTEAASDHSSEPQWCETYWLANGLRPEVCAGCLAKESHSYCWQVNTSPCCKRDRSVCRHCDVYISYQSQCGKTQTVELQLADGSVLVGEVHVPSDSRLSQVLNDANRAFLAITNVTEDASYPSDARPVRVLLINKQAIAILKPIGEAELATRPEMYRPESLATHRSQEVA